jgi:hypothetical protein
MRVTDVDVYQQWCAEVSRSEVGEKFRAILEAWADAAEKLMEPDDWGTDPIDAIRRTLPEIEKNFGLLTAEQLGQLLVTLIAYWQPGTALAEEMSPIEIRLVQEVAATKLAEMAEATAQEASDGA